MMGGDELTRWEALIEREAEGEALSRDEQAFVERYASEHPEAGEELQVLRGLERALGSAPRGEQPGDQQLIAQVFQQGQALERGRRRRAVIASGFALAAGTALWFGSQTAGEPGKQPTAVVAPAAASAKAVLAVAAPDVRVDGAAVAAGVVLRQGQRIETGSQGSCLELERDVRACLGPGSLARLTSLGNDVVLSLERGAVAADLGLQAPGLSFSVQSGTRSVRAVGTRFGLEIASAGVMLQVLSGTVEVSGDGATYRVSAPARTALGSPRIEALSEAEARSTAELLTPLMPGAARAALPSPAAPLPAAAVERPAPSSPAPVASAESAGELLARAREQRAAGAMKDAAKAYRRLLGEHPASGEAHTARVALGQLELSSLGDPASALAHFSEYLRRGGALEQEARYGQVRALAALGRAAEERQAIAAFLAKYPKAMQAAALKERLKTLGGSGATLKE